MSRRLLRLGIGGGVAVFLAAAWTVIAWSLVDQGLRTALRVIAAYDGIVGGYRSALLLSWRTMAFGLLLVVAILFVLVVLRLARSRGIPRWAVALALVAFLGVGGLLNAARPFAERPAANRWGFCPIFAPGETSLVELGWEGFPPMKVTPNRDGYRDDDWPIPPPQDGTNRVVLVGDSHVWGHGVPDSSGLLDKYLEQELNAAGAGRHDVWNVALAPASLWYYAAAIQRVAPVAGARYAVAVVYPDDVCFVDEQRAMADKGSTFCRLAAEFDLIVDLLWMFHHVSAPQDYATDPRVQEANRAWFEQLVAFSEAQGLTLIVWQPVGAVELLKPYHGRPGLVFLEWQEEFRTPCGMQGCDRRGDPAFTYPDGHPLPSTNAMVARVIARTILRLEAARGAPGAE